MTTTKKTRTTDLTSVEIACVERALKVYAGNDQQSPAVRATATRLGRRFGSATDVKVVFIDNDDE